MNIRTFTPVPQPKPDDSQQGSTSTKSGKRPQSLKSIESGVMTSSNDNRLDRIESLLESFIAASIADRQSSDERMTRLEQTMEANYRESNERLSRIEQVVESNNKFLESFSIDLRRYTDSMNNLANRIDGVIATTNQDRQETNSRLSAIQRQVSAIAKHLRMM